MVATNIIPLFPLEVVLMPGVPLPLHIFEERYKNMIGECLEYGKEFGVVCGQEGEIYKVGCTAEIVGVLERYDDGTMDIITKGVRRFIIRNIREEKPYLESEITYFDDEIEKIGEELQELVKVGIRRLREIDNLKGTEEDYSFLESMDLKATSFFLASNVDFTLKEKQQLMELTSTVERVKKSVELLQAVKKRVESVRLVKRIIGGNGNLRRKTNT
jgi:Lon protease-like protein